MNDMSVRKPNYPNPQRRYSGESESNAHKKINPEARKPRQTSANHSKAAASKSAKPASRLKQETNSADLSQRNQDLRRTGGLERRTLTSTQQRYAQMQHAAAQSHQSVTRRNTTQARKPDTGSQQKSRNVRDAFGKDWDIVLRGSTKTRKIPVRILALIFTFVIAVIILAGPLQDFFAQQEEKRVLNAQLAESKAELESLQQQVDLWNDPSYVQAQARKRLGFVLPGQTLYYVSGDLATTEDEKKQSEEARAIALRRKAMPFYIGLWKSIEIAGSAEIGTAGISNPEDTPLVNEPKPAESKELGSKTDNSTGNAGNQNTTEEKSQQQNQSGQPAQQQNGGE